MHVFHLLAIATAQQLDPGVDRSDQTYCQPSTGAFY